MIETKEQFEQKRNEAAIASMEFLQKINFIVSKIRETSSGIMTMGGEKPADSVSITKVEFPQQGGVLTYFDKMEYPIKGFPYGDTVEKVDEAKKVLRSIAESFVRILRGGIIKSAIFALFFKKDITTLFQGLIASFYAPIRNCKSKEDKYCVSVREIRRTLKLVQKWKGMDYFAENETDYEPETWDKLIDFICMLFEYDDAYRYRLQNVLPELNKENAKKNPIKEFQRLISIFSSREKEDGMKSKWKMISRFVFLFNFDKNLKEIVRMFLLEINLDRIKMDEADLFHAKYKKGYDFEKKEEKEILK